METVLDKNLKLPGGDEMPVFGIGTWEMSGKECEKIVPLAIDLGCRLIDTAQLYENEKSIGMAIKKADRSDLFITSKVAPQNLHKNAILRACEGSLRDLGTDYLDLYLIHWPNDEIPIEETLDAMAQLVEEGKVQNIGLSNYDVSGIKRAESVSPVPIGNVQNKLHPLVNEQDVPDYCISRGISFTAYSPLARGKVVSDETLSEIGGIYGKTAAQVSLKWLLQKGYAVIPKSSSEKHLRENLEMDGWELTMQDISRIDSLSTPSFK